MTDQQQSPNETLRYRLPDRQDPVVVLTALANANYPAVPEHIDGHQYVAIFCPRGREDDRERIRAVLERDADQTSLEGPQFERTIRFDDET